MGDITDINDRAKAAAVEASKPGKFNFIDRVVGRNYPTEEVVVYLDERAGYEIDKAWVELARADDQIKAVGEDEVLLKDARKNRAQVAEQIEALAEAAAQSRFVFHLEGISTREYDKVVDQAREFFPLEYRETRNPITFAPERTVIASEEREIFFRTAMWAKVIRRVVDPNGHVDDEITPEWIGQVNDLLPAMAQQAIQDGVDALRMTTDWMDRLQAEDFFPKS